VFLKTLSKVSTSHTERFTYLSRFLVSEALLEPISFGLEKIWEHLGLDHVQRLETKDLIFG